MNIRECVGIVKLFKRGICKIIISDKDVRNTI